MKLVVKMEFTGVNGRLDDMKKKIKSVQSINNWLFTTTLAHGVLIAVTYFTIVDDYYETKSLVDKMCKMSNSTCC